MTRIKGQGILLKTIQPESAETIYQAIDSSRQHLGRWLPFVSQTTSVSDTRRFIQSVLTSKCPKKDEIFEIWYHEKFAGLIGFKEIDVANRQVEIGYWLRETMTGKGIMLDSCRMLIQHAFSTMNLNRIMIKVAIGNKRSIAIPEKLGFLIEGIQREGELLHGEFVDLRVYSLLKSDWK
jgi:ribosomal-protein-serine acetyltransferase